MPFAYVDDSATSDVTFCASGASLEELFGAAVDAVTAAMVADLDAVRPETQFAIEAGAEHLDLLLVRLLDEVVFLKDRHGVLLRASRVSVEASAPPFHVRATLCGARIDRQRHALLTDVKAVTLHDLRVDRRGELWSARVTLDV